MNFVGRFSGRTWLGLVTVAALVASIGLARCCLADSEEQLPAVEIITTTNLLADAELARQLHKPILILFSMEDCAYCHYVEEEHLKPMLRNQEYRDKVIIRRIMTDNFDDVIDFDGTKISSIDFSERYNAFVTPTVVFLNHEGAELSKRLLGVSNTEFYGGELDDGLDISLHKIRQQLALNQRQAIH